MKKKFNINTDMWVDSNCEWVVKIPFGCIKDEDVIITFINDETYINEHKEIFQGIQGGQTYDNECEVVSKNKPDCDIDISIERLNELGGQVFFNEDGSMQYIPPLF